MNENNIHGWFVRIPCVFLSEHAFNSKPHSLQTTNHEIGFRCKTWLINFIRILQIKVGKSNCMYRRFNYTLFPDSNCNISVLQVVLVWAVFPFIGVFPTHFVQCQEWSSEFHCLQFITNMDIKKKKMLLINPTLFLLRLNVSLIKTIQFLDRKNQIERQRIIKELDNIWFQYLS